MEPVVILAGARTPIGAFQGALASRTAPQLGGHAIRVAVERSGVNAAEIDEVIMGCVLSSGVGQAPARQAALEAGLPHSIPATTVNKVCGSGLKAILLARQAILAGDANLVIAGGMESMSQVPYALDRARTGYRLGHGRLVDLLIHDGLWDPYGDCHMGECADATAAELGLSREALDAYAAESVRRARQAADHLAEEIAPISVPQRKGPPAIVSADEGPTKADVTKLASLPTVFTTNGVTTAGNASSLNDGAAALVVASPEYVRDHELPTLGRIVASAQYAHQPARFTTAPGFAIERLLAKTGLTVGDIDLFEVNEAFALVALAAQHHLSIPPERLNVNGGAVALGHPIGMTGARLVLTALYQLRRQGGRYAIACPCIGGGEAIAVLLESA
jgi:acetyl-CoA C-acetyltransferase